MVVPPTSHVSASEKAGLRRMLRANRRAFSAEHVFSAHAALYDRIAHSQIIVGYWPVTGEPDVRPFLGSAAQRGVVTGLPRLEFNSTKMTFHQWIEGDATENYRTFEQPLESAALIIPDLILAPLVGFDRALNRLGQGGGHYDRAFLAYPNAYKIGIAWSVQEVPAVPVEAHDIALDAIMTEKEWITL